MNTFIKKINTNTKKFNIFNNIQTESGLSMIELIVTVGIFVTITSVVLASYPKFGSRIVLSNVAYQIALSVRQTQTYGLSVKEFGTSSVFPGYGIYFPNPINDNKSFTIFADINGDKKYNLLACGANGSECLEKFTIQSSEAVYALCGNLKKDGIPKFNTISDANISNCRSINSLHVSFTRPDPDANITAYMGGTTYNSSYSDSEIVIANPRGDVKTIVIWPTGQIYVE
jgi:type II secretory pathway pseudopilin PulG